MKKTFYAFLITLIIILTTPVFSFASDCSAYSSQMSSYTSADQESQITDENDSIEQPEGPERPELPDQSDDQTTPGSSSGAEPPSNSSDPDDRAIIISFDARSINAHVLSTAAALNDMQSLEEFFSDKKFSAAAYDSDGIAHEAYSGEWDLSEVDITAPGLYGAYSYIELPEGYTLAQGVYAPEIMYTVSVQTPGSPDINCANYLTDGSSDSFFFPWVLSDEQKDQLNDFSVYLKSEESEWRKLRSYSALEAPEISPHPTAISPSDGESSASDTSKEAIISVDGLTLFSSALQYDEIYDMQVDYPGGHTYIVSFMYDGAILIVSYSDGTRDGSGDGTDLPDVVQPEPDNSSSGNHHHHGNGHTSSNDDSNASGSSAPSADQPSDMLPADDKQPSDPINSSDDAGVTAGDNAVNDPDISGTSADSLPVYSDISSPAAPSSEKTADKTYKEAVSPRSSLSSLISHVFTRSDNASASSKTPNKLDSANSKISTVNNNTEQDASDSITVSGARLRAMAAYGESLTVTKETITAVLPPELINSLVLADDSRFSLKVERPSQDRIIISAALNGAPIYDITGTIISADAGTVFKNAQRVIVSGPDGFTAPVGCANGILSFTICRTGTYTIAEDTQHSAADSAPAGRRNGSTGKIAAAAAAAVALSAAAASFIFIYRRRHRK